MEPMKPMQPMEPLDFGPAWWPAELGEPDTSGSANEARFAFFAAKHLLAVSRDGKISVYDTGGRGIVGVSVENGEVRFTDEDGPVAIEDLCRAD